MLTLSIQNNKTNKKGVPMDNNILGERIKTLRIKRKISQKALAERLGITQAALSNYEKGTRQPSIDQLVSIAKGFNTSVDYLLGISNVETLDDDVKAISNYTGLSDDAIEDLSNINTICQFNKFPFDFFNSVIKFLYSNSYTIIDYFDNLSEFNKLFNLYSDENILYISSDKLDKIDSDMEHYFNRLMVYKYRLSKSFDRLLDDENVNFFDNINITPEQYTIWQIRENKLYNNE